MLLNHWAYPHLTHPRVVVDLTDTGFRLSSRRVQTDEADTYQTSVSRIGMPFQGEHTLSLHVTSDPDQSFHGWSIGVICNDHPSDNYRAFYDPTFYGLHGNQRWLWRFDGGRPHMERVLSSSSCSNDLLFDLIWSRSTDLFYTMTLSSRDHPVPFSWSIPFCSNRPFRFVLSITRLVCVEIIL